MPQQQNVSGDIRPDVTHTCSAKIRIVSILVTVSQSALGASEISDGHLELQIDPQYGLNNTSRRHNVSDQGEVVNTVAFSSFLGFIFVFKYSMKERRLSTQLLTGKERMRAGREKLKLQVLVSWQDRTRSSVNYAKYWLDQFFLFSGLEKD